MNNYEPIPDCGDYQDAEMAEWAAQELLLEQEYIRHQALVVCQELIAGNYDKSIKIAADILQNQLKKDEAEHVRH